METTGYGISAEVIDDCVPHIVVDSAGQTIGFANPCEEPKTYVAWTFDAFLECTEDEVTKAYWKHNNSTWLERLERTL